jgi:predicted nuclease of predicted toxin-antitoxin system
VKLLFDENLSPRLVSRLSPLFPDSQHVDLVGLHGQPDKAIWEHAARHEFAIVSKDNDFRQLSFLAASGLSVGSPNM